MRCPGRRITQAEGLILMIRKQQHRSCCESASAEDQFLEKDFTWDLDGVLVIQHAKTPLGWLVGRPPIVTIGLSWGDIYILSFPSAEER